MINWQALFFNSFWIVGLAVLLAAASYHHWLARQTHTSLKEQFNQASFLIFFWLSFALICIGLAGTSGQIWETAVWMILAILSVVFMVGAVFRYRLARVED